MFGRRRPGTLTAALLAGRSGAKRLFIFRLVRSPSMEWRRCSLLRDLRVPVAGGRGDVGASGRPEPHADNAGRCPRERGTPTLDKRLLLCKYRTLPPK